MQEYSAQFKRINRLLQADKSVMSDGCQALMLQDLAEKLNEYFDLIGLPKMELAYKNGKYSISLAFEAERIKKFNVLK